MGFSSQQATNRLLILVILINVFELHQINCQVSPGQGHLACSRGYCLPSDYNEMEPPLPNDGSPLWVDAEFDIAQIIKTDDKEFQVNIIMYLSLTWRDPRIVRVGLRNDSTDETAEGNKTLKSSEPISLELIKHLWVPDLYIFDLIRLNVPKFYDPFAGLWILDDTKVFFSQEIEVKYLCPMRFNMYPLDQQKCSFRISSYAYDETRLIFNTSVLNYRRETKATLLDYDVTEVKRLQNPEFIWLTHGNYSLAGFDMGLKRHRLKYVINYYLPSGLFVGVSWVSFLIPVDMVPGRMAILVTMFLVLINITNNIFTVMPNTEGLTAISIWLISCILFVFAALLAYAALLFKQTQGNRKSHKKTLVKSLAVSKEPAFVKEKAFRQVSAHMKSECEYDSSNNTNMAADLAQWDWNFFLLFPGLFMLFNIVYWSVCLMT